MALTLPNKSPSNNPEPLSPQSNEAIGVQTSVENIETRTNNIGYLILKLEQKITNKKGKTNPKVLIAINQLKDFETLYDNYDDIKVPYDIAKDIADINKDIPSSQKGLSIKVADVYNYIQNNLDNGISLEDMTKNIYETNGRIVGSDKKESISSPSTSTSQNEATNEATAETGQQNPSAQDEGEIVDTKVPNPNDIEIENENVEYRVSFPTDDLDEFIGDKSLFDLKEEIHSVDNVFDGIATLEKIDAEIADYPQDIQQKIRSTDFYRRLSDGESISISDYQNSFQEQADEIYNDKDGGPYVVKLFGNKYEYQTKKHALGALLTAAQMLSNARSLSDIAKVNFWFKEYTGYFIVGGTALISLGLGTGYKILKTKINGSYETMDQGIKTGDAIALSNSLDETLKTFKDMGLNDGEMKDFSNSVEKIKSVVKSDGFGENLKSLSELYRQLGRMRSFKDFMIGSIFQINKEGKGRIKFIVGNINKGPSGWGLKQQVEVVREYINSFKELNLKMESISDLIDERITDETKRARLKKSIAKLYIQKDGMFNAWGLIRKKSDPLSFERKWLNPEVKKIMDELPSDFFDKSENQSGKNVLVTKERFLNRLTKTIDTINYAKVEKRLNQIKYHPEISDELENELTKKLEWLKYETNTSKLNKSWAAIVEEIRNSDKYNFDLTNIDNTGIKSEDILTKQQLQELKNSFSDNSRNPAVTLQNWSEISDYLTKTTDSHKGHVLTNIIHLIQSPDNTPFKTTSLATSDALLKNFWGTNSFNTLVSTIYNYKDNPELLKYLSERAIGGEKIKFPNPLNLTKDQLKVSYLNHLKSLAEEAENEYKKAKNSIGKTLAEIDKEISQTKKNIARATIQGDIDEVIKSTNNLKTLRKNRKLLKELKDKADTAKLERDNLVTKYTTINNGIDIDNSQQGGIEKQSGETKADLDKLKDEIEQERAALKEQQEELDKLRMEIEQERAALKEQQDEFIKQQNDFKREQDNTQKQKPDTVNDRPKPNTNIEYQTSNSILDSEGKLKPEFSKALHNQVLYSSQYSNVDFQNMNTELEKFNQDITDGKVNKENFYEKLKAIIENNGAKYDENINLIGKQGVDNFKKSKVHIIFEGLHEYYNSVNQSTKDKFLKNLNKQLTGVDNKNVITSFDDLNKLKNEISINDGYLTINGQKLINYTTFIDNTNEFYQYLEKSGNSKISINNEIRGAINSNKALKTIGKIIKSF